MRNSTFVSSEEFNVYIVHATKSCALHYLKLLQCKVPDFGVWGGKSDCDDSVYIYIYIYSSLDTLFFLKKEENERRDGLGWIMNGFGPKTPLVIYLFNLFITKCYSFFILQTKTPCSFFGLRRGAEPPTDLRTRLCRVYGGRPWNYCPLFPKVFRKKKELSASQALSTHFSCSAAWMW